MLLIRLRMPVQRDDACGAFLYTLTFSMEDKHSDRRDTHEWGYLGMAAACFAGLCTPC